MTSLSRMIANGRPTFSDVACANLRAPEVLNLKLTIGSPVRLIETGLRVGQVAARDQNLLLDDDRRLRRLRVQQHFRVLRQSSLLRLVRRNAGIDHPEIHLGGLAENFLQARRILQAGHLHENAVDALTLDQRLDGTEFVDPLLDDLDRLLDRLADAFGDGRLRHRQPDQAAASILHLEAALAAGTQQTAERLRQLAQLGERGRRVGLRHAHLDHVAADVDAAGEANARVAQRPARIVDDLIELVRLDRVGIHFKQQVGTALQVEPEHDVALRPLRPGLDGCFRKEIRHGEQAHEQCRRNDRDDLPASEIEHGLNRSLVAAPTLSSPPRPSPARPWRARP